MKDTIWLLSEKMISKSQNRRHEREVISDMRKTKIICTIGPASESEEKLRALMLAGMNVARFNFSHGTHEEHKEKFDRVIKVSNELGLPVATLLDTKGPEIRLKDIEGGKTDLKAGQQFILTTDEVLGNNEKVTITYKNLKNDISVGTTILIDDGLIEMVVEDVNETDIICKVINGGPISNHKGVNVPGAILSMPYISDVDRSDIMFGCDMGFDFLAASFVRCKEDILEVRKIIEEHGSHMKIIAKIENMQGIRNLEEILEAVRITAGGDVYDFQGTICLVDCVNFMDQIVDQETVDRQLKHCNLAVLTKTDLSDEQKIMEICGKIREINPVCPIVQSENGNLSLDFLNQDLLKYQWAECEETTNSVETKPKTLYMEFEGEVAKESLDEFLRTMSPDVHRIKGFFQVQEEGWQKVDVVGKKIDYAPYEPQEKSQLVFISKIGTAVIKKIFAAWEDKVGLPMKLKN